MVQITKQFKTHRKVFQWRHVGASQVKSIPQKNNMYTTITYVMMKGPNKSNLNKKNKKKRNIPSPTHYLNKHNRHPQHTNPTTNKPRSKSQSHTVA